MSDTIEQAAAEYVSSEIAKSDDAAVASASADFTPLNAGTGTLGSLHASSATQPLAGATMHGGSDTQPLSSGFNVPTDNDEYLARLRAEVRASEAATVESLRRHAIGFVETTGHVSGLSKSNENER